MPVTRLLLDCKNNFYFPEGRPTFAWKYVKWRHRVRFGPRVTIDSGEKLTVVLLSYKRPQNIEPIVRSALICDFVEKVVVCNNNPDYRIEKWVRVSDWRLVLSNQKKNMGPRFRFDVATREQGQYLFFIDDDIFLYPEQIKALFLGLLKDPSVPHGVRGQVVFDGQEFVDGVYGVDAKVDILNGVYAFTKAHLSEYFRLDEELKGLPMADDIVLSFTGESAPSCHNVGEILLCPTEALPGVAVWKEPDFLKNRLAALERLAKVKSLAQCAVSLPSLAPLPVMTSQPLFAIDTLNDHVINQQTQPIVISQYRARLVVRGWAVDAGVKDLAGGVYINIDGKLYPTYYGGDRKDVADHFQVQAYRRSGFQRSFLDLKPGLHTLSIAVLTKDRKAYYKPEQTITFEISRAGLSQELHPLVLRGEAKAKNEQLVRIRLMRNFFPHWAEHSGAHQFTNHMNGRRFQFDQQVVPLGFERFPVLKGGFQDRLRHLVKKNGLQWYDLNNLRAELETLIECFNKRPDIIHCLDGEYVQYLPRFLKKMGRVRRFPPLIASFHQPPEILRKVINKEIVRLLDHVVVYCRAQASYFERFISFSKISLVPHGIDTGFFQPGTRKADGTFKCLTVGFWLRDFDTLWKVIRRMLAYPDIEFHLVTPKQEPPGNFANVRVYQNLEDIALLNVYQQSDILFMPLLDSAANNAILEAAACGLPIVSNSVGGVPDYTDQSFARLVAPGDADGFSDIILELRSESDTRQQMGRAARLFAEANLTWPKITQQMLDVYERVLASRVC